jgi:D-alanine-D-alanine ligase
MKPKVALVTGGYSGEAIVSYKSADTIQHHIDAEVYDVYRIDIAKEGWFYDDRKGNRIAVNKSDFTVNVDGTQLVFDAVFLVVIRLHFPREWQQACCRRSSSRAAGKKAA